MSVHQTEVAKQLHAAYLKSGMSPKAFYDYIVDTRESIIVGRRDETLSFKIRVPVYEEDIEWFGWNEELQLWLEL